MRCLPLSGLPVGVYVVEDDEALREDFIRAVRDSPQLALVGATGSARTALRDLERKIAVDVMLVDLGLPDGDGVSLIRALRRELPQAKALVISVFADDWRVLTALSAGASGYLLKDTDDAGLVKAIGEVHQGDAPLSPQVARYVLRMFEHPSARSHLSADRQVPLPAQRESFAGPQEKLTLREIEVLELVARGHSGPQVAAQLGLSLHTVSTHLRNCHAKLGAKTRLQAINRARAAGQID